MPAFHQGKLLLVRHCALIFEQPLPLNLVYFEKTVLKCGIVDSFSCFYFAESSIEQKLS